MSDPVNHPAHYTQGSIECIEAMEAQATPEEFAGYLRLCAVKYLWRFRHKGKASEDLAKAQWYLQRLADFTSAGVTIEHKPSFTEEVRDFAEKIERVPQEIRDLSDVPSEVISRCAHGTHVGMECAGCRGYARRDTNAE